MRNLFSVEGKHVVVTGGSRGIGLMIAQGFVENGAHVYISARKAEACDGAAQHLRQYGDCHSFPADLSTAEGMDTLFAGVSQKTEKVDVLVNNAGATWGAAIDEFPEEGWDKVMGVNVKGLFFLSQRFLPLLRNAATAEDPARIINIGSIDGIRTSALETYSYAASKAAVHHLTKAMAKRLARDMITVNAIAPGPFESKMMAATLTAMQKQIEAQVPRGRIGSPEDMAGTSLYLASRAGAYVTGVIIPVDGGISGTNAPV
ncbi:MAG: SDR family oxidoreductase [Pseudomonadota bacterium]